MNRIYGIYLRNYVLGLKEAWLDLGKKIEKSEKERVSQISEGKITWEIKWKKGILLNLLGSPYCVSSILQEIC